LKNCVIIIGNDILYNKEFVEYIKSLSKNSLKKIDAYLSIEDYKDFYKIFEIYKSIYNNIVIFVSKKNFTSISKVLATFSNQDLILKNDIFVPENSKIVNNGDFVISIDNLNINLVLANPLEKIENISICKKNDVKILNIFGMDKESIKILINPLSEVHEIKYEIIHKIDDWYLLLIDKYQIGNIDAFINSLNGLFGNRLIDKDDMIDYIIEYLDKNFFKISFAESCTGGLIASTFVKKSGVSSVFDCGVVSYSNSIKSKILNVNENDLINVGAVSSEVVFDMAKGVLDTSSSDYSIAVSGIAGPSGGTPQKPVGTVYIAVYCKDGRKIVNKKLFNGNREYIQQQTLLSAIVMLLKLIIE
jgi:nicotinamide-nucleotide amidase